MNFIKQKLGFNNPSFFGGNKLTKRIQEYAKKTFLAIDNRYRSVIKVFPNNIDYISESSGYYLGIKDVANVSPEFIERLTNIGYICHTMDKSSHSGRAIDLDLINPITGRFMTGSSSGTALNVFLGINDLGIGTDGGGSVLAPAISLNLYGMIHPELGKSDYQEIILKKSTDGILFSPSIGLLSRNLIHIIKVLNNEFPLMDKVSKIELRIGLDETIKHSILQQFPKHYYIQRIDLSNKYHLPREKLIEKLTLLLNTYDIVISKEGPVDVDGVGDSIFGHFDHNTQMIQQKAHKGFIRVINIAGAISFTVPTGHLSEGYVIIAKNTLENVSILIEVAQLLSSQNDELLDRYFGNISAYFDYGI